MISTSASTPHPVRSPMVSATGREAIPAGDQAQPRPCPRRKAW